MFELNFVGWSALLGAGLVPSLLLWRVGVPRRTSLVVGEIAAFSVVKLRDHLRWRASLVQMHVDGSPEIVRAAVAKMREAGLAVEYEEVPHDVPGERFRWQPAVKYRQADNDKVQAALGRRMS